MTQLQAQITFDAIAAKPEYINAPSDVQRDVALRYFDDNYASKAEFKQAPADVQEDARQRFLSDYKVPEIQHLQEQGRSTAPVKQMDFGNGRRFDQLPFFSAKPGEHDQLSGYVNASSMALGGITTPAHDLVNPFDRNAMERNNKMYQEQYPGIENDDGFLGQAYRFRNNRYTNIVGQGLGALGMARNIATSLPKTVLGKVPMIGKWGEDARRAIATAGLFSGGTNATDVAHGKQNWVEGIGNTAMDVVTAPWGGSSRWKNGAIEGAGGYLSGYGSSVLGDVTHGKGIDWDKANKMAIEQGAIGLGLGAALGGHGKKAAPVQHASVTHNVKKQAQPIKSVPVVGTRERSTGKITTNAAAKRKLMNTILDLKKQGRHNEARLLVSNVTRYMPENQAAAFKDEVARAHSQTTAKPVKEHVTKAEKFDALVAKIHEMRKQDRHKEADLALKGYTPETKAKVYDRVKQQEAAEKKAASDQNKLDKEQAKAAKDKASAEKKQYEADFKKLEAEEKAANAHKAKLEAEAKAIQDLKRQEAIKSEQASQKDAAAARKKQMDKLKADIAERHNAEIEALKTEEAASQKRQRELEAHGRKLKNLKERQAIKDQLALERAESKNRQRELRQLQGDIKARASEQAAEAAATKGPEITIKDGFVLTKSGNKVFGRVHKEMGLPEGELRLEDGIPGKDGYGYQHILSDTSKLKRIIKAGFVNADGSADVVGFIEHVGNNFNKVIDEGNGKYMLVVEPDVYIKVVKHIEKNGEKFYGVTTGYPNRASNITTGLKDKGWKTVWEGRNPSSTQSSPSVAPVSDASAKGSGQPAPGARSQTSSTPQNSTSKKTSQPHQEINKTLVQAHKQGMEARVWYEAEGGNARVNEDRVVAEGKARDGRTEANVKGGEALELIHGEPRTVSIVDRPYSDANGNIVYTTLDETGIPKTRHVDHAESGSKTLRVELTGEKAKFEYVENPATGKKQARNVETGEFITPGKSKGSAYTSTVKADLAKMQEVVKKAKAGKATAAEIRETARLSEKDFEPETAKLDGGSIEDICKKGLNNV